MSNITEEIEKLSGIMSKLGEAHNMLAKTSLYKEKYQPISGLLAKAKVELFNFCNDHKAALQNKVSDVNAEKIKQRILEAYYDGFNQAHYSHVHPEICEPKECESAGKEYMIKKEKLINSDLEEYASIVNERKDNIPADFKQVTGHNSPKEMIAYEKGREDEQEVIMKWIEQWDGSSNSAMGTLLKKKFDERKDNVGVWVKASARLPEKLAYYNCKFRGIPIIFYIDSRNETISYDSQIVDKKYWKFTQWLDESQPKQKEVDEYEDEMPPL